MAVTGVSHFGLCITDVDASLAFYRDVLGFRVLRQSVTTSANVAQLLELDEITMSLTFIELDGTIITANQNFPDVLGYRLESRWSNTPQT